jgi:hypothetical protein
VGLQRVGGDDHPSKVQGASSGAKAGTSSARHRPGALPAPGGWRGPSPPPGAPGGRRRRVGRRRQGSCRRRPPPAAGWPSDRDVAGRPARRRSRRRLRRGPGGRGCGGWWPRPGRRSSPGLLAGAQGGPDRLGRIGGPFGDRGDRPGAGQDRGGGQAQDRHQRVAAASGSSRVRDHGQAGQQVQGVGLLELARIGLGELGQRGWDRG